VSDAQDALQVVLDQLAGQPEREWPESVGEQPGGLGTERKVSTYSKGMKRKLTIAAGIIHRPQVLFLDEPTTGIDVASARHIRQLILELNKAGTTILLTTHYIEEAERLCHRIAFIVDGRLVRVDTLANLVQGAQGKAVVELAVSRSARDLMSPFRAAFPDVECEVASDSALRVISTHTVALGPFIRLLEEQGAQVYEARKLRPSLEDVFVRITGVEAERLRREKEKGGGPA
jgi:ABC-2 type transport system ATP-binding protein